MSTSPLLTLFTIGFISQIVLVSIIYPRRLRGLHAHDVSLKAYARANYAIAAIGLSLLPMHLHWQAAGLVTSTLLAVALFLMLQLTPLAFPSMRRLSSRLASIKAETDAMNSETYRSTTLFDAVGGVPVATAVLLATSYLVLAASTWGGDVDTQLLAMVIFTSTQLLFAGSIAWTLASLRRAAPEKLAERYEALQLIAPLFVYTSAMLSIYWFGKAVLGAIDEPLLRPTMMSVFLQMMAVCVFETLYFRGTGRVRPADISST